MGQRMLLIVMFHFAAAIHGIPKTGFHAKISKNGEPCECSLFLWDDLWLPKYEVMSLKNELQIDCTNLGEAAEKCKAYCTDEISALNSLYQKDPSVLKNYPPSQNVPCKYLPVPTVPFAKICGSQSYILTARILGPPVCCDSSFSRIWCGSTGFVDFYQRDASLSNNLFEGRKLDLQKDQNDVSHNEIDGSSDLDSKPGKKGTPYVPPGTKSWMYSILKYFGYNTFADFMKGIDIFSLPVKIQATVRTYKDEVNLGRCYMEFTTFKVFTKQENPFEELLRKRRSFDLEGPITRFDGPEESPSQGFGKMMPFDGEIIKNFVGGFANILQRSDGTKQYADILSSVLPVITQFVTGGSSETAPSPASLLFKFIGPLLSQMSSMKPPPSNSIANDATKPPQKQSWPDTGSLSAVASSPLSSMAMTMIGNLISNFFNSPGAENRIEAAHPTTVKPTEPTTPPPSVNMASGLRTLIKLFMQSAGSSTAVARPIETPKPVSNTANDKLNLNVEDKEEKRFIHMLLELIRPVFISIVGNAPGDNGVKEIRKVSTLSTLGRVDDTLREEVDSPFFCFKKYLVNKAWSITENGVRTVVSTFTPEEQARMMKSIAG